jgi:hypothetical protein
MKDMRFYLGYVVGLGEAEHGRVTTLDGAEFWYVLLCACGGGGCGMCMRSVKEG